MSGWLTQLHPYHWIGLAVLLGLLDVLLGANFFLVWCGLSALLVGLLSAILPISYSIQLLLFAVGIFAVLIIWPKLNQQWLKQAGLRRSGLPILNQRSRQYIGREFTLEEPIINGLGKVKVDDSIWRIEGPDLPIGTKIKIIGTDGAILKVEETKSK
jgi:membrane protein implicated in regulation of membrane protease activity